MKKFLFVVWDGPQVSYLEGLFYPIFLEIQKQRNIEFHIIQFTWGNPEKIRKLEKVSEAIGFHYTYKEVSRRPHPAPGAFLTVWTGSRFIERYIRQHGIDIVMPRSTMPAIMINQISGRIPPVKTVFDADGLPLEERIDFSGLKRSSFYYKMLRAVEVKLLKRADAVITRSQKAVNIHLNTVGQQLSDKFFTVSNGRDPDFFKPDSEKRLWCRKQLNISVNDVVFVYCGSLGMQYGLEEMFEIFSKYCQKQPQAKFLIITGSPAYLEDRIPETIKSKVIVRSLPFDEVPMYLNAGDIAFAIRKPTYSMQGIAPIKLGEYMLMGLPCIASKGIGDTEPILSQAPDCFLFDHDQKENINKATQWALTIKADSNKIRNFALQYFSIQKSAADYMNVIDYLVVK